MKNTRMLSKEVSCQSNRNSSESIPRKSTRQNGSEKSEIRRNEEGTVEVLYQKMGDRWFAFSLLGEEVFVGSITPDEIMGVSAESVSDVASTPTAPRKREVGLI